ncbi:MAG: tRNA uridine-5-carboxymethylaminomethyl(34) synthesis enzyme MnmG [Verrucomicrobiota bacterium]|nr:tRNA uridine-5-carboxymethylaminomethyl(34) synthesis enzyme MnmG [Verrucomicrobiota bacterium]
MNIYEKQFDVIVVGAGHAGCEAALIAARMGAETLFLTINVDNIAQMSCNPAIGGIAKGQVVREIDALGGEMAKNTDAAGIQFRMLNKKKGPAVWSPRAQCDKVLYQQRMKQVIEKQKNLFVHQAEVTKIEIDSTSGLVIGVRTCFDDFFYGKSIVLCPGTFLRGLLHYGSKKVEAGRAGSFPANELSISLKNDLKLEMGRLKTGTPARILADSIDFSQLTKQDGEDSPFFSFYPAINDFDTITPDPMPQLPCYMGWTTVETGKIIRDNLDRSPLFSGTIEGIGTRYCPSIEDKIVKFPHHETHHVFLEPEGAYTDEYYLNGVSTSLPVDVQWKIIHSIPGFENALLSRYAYAIEYDFVFPHQLNSTLALKKYPNLFLAGQINGTSGYEEAAGQGLVAGINAVLKVKGESPFTLGREQAYIGVMIDDLITKDIIEPYRLFTSRAEYRLSLRQDNADRRLLPLAAELGLISDEILKKHLEYEKSFEEEKTRLKALRDGNTSYWKRLADKNADYYAFPEADKNLSPRVAEQLTIEAKYEGYLKREKEQVAKLQQLKKWRIPEDFDYSVVNGLKKEARTKLEKIKPENLAQAQKIDGVTPAELALLQVHLKRGWGTSS